MREGQSTLETATQLEPMRGSGDLRLAIIVNPDLPLGSLANTVAAISVGIGCANPGLGNVRLADNNGLNILNSADRPVPILQAGAAELGILLRKTQPSAPQRSVVAFPAFARSLHSFAEYEDTFPTRSLSDEPLDGIGLCGPSKWVRSLTGSLKLLR